MPPRPRMIGFRRVTSASPCDFCAMLASRGAKYVYRSDRSASFEAHDNCSCSAEPVWRRGDDPPEIVALREEFERVTAGIQGTRAKLVEWRRYWRQRNAASSARPTPTPVVARPVARLDELMASAPTTEEWATMARTLSTAEYEEVLAAYRRQIAEAIDGTYGDLRVRVDTAVVRRDGILIEGEVLDAAGRPVGKFQRGIGRERDGTLVASHAHLDIASGVQGSGFAEAFNAHLYEMYRAAGVQRVELVANIDVGGYAWATQGYDFLDDYTAERFVERALAKIEAALAGAKRMPSTPGWKRDLAPPPAREELEALAEYLRRVQAGEIPASAAEIARFGRQAGQGGRAATWAGKWLMLGSSWAGRLIL